MRKYYFWSIIAILLFVLVAPALVFGQGTTNPPSLYNSSTGKLDNPIPNVSDIVSFVKVILEAVLKIGLPVVALAIVYSGFLFIFAQGKPEDLKTAKRAFLYSAIGAIVLLGSWVIAQIISDTVLSL